MDLSESIFNKYCVKIPELIEIEKILKQRTNIYNKRLPTFITNLYVNGNYSLLIILSMLNVRECIVTVHVVG